MMQEENKRPDEQLTASEEDRFSAFEQVTVPVKTAPKKRLNRNTRSVIVITAVAAALALVLALLLPLLSEQNAGSSNTSGDLSKPEQVYPLYDRSDDDIEGAIVQAVTFKTAESEYMLRYHAKEALYQLVGYEDLSVAAASIDELINSATTLNAYDRVKTVESLKDFGLETPQGTVTVTYHDNSKTTLHIGDVTPDSAGYYVRLNDSNEVYIVETGSISYFLLTKEQWIDRTLLSSPTVAEDDADGTAVLKELTVNTNGESLTLRRRTTADGEEYSYATYLITKPYVRMVDETVSETLESFTYLIAMQAEVLHPTAADKQKYGFSNPYSTLDITLAVETVRADKTASGDSAIPESDEETELEYYNAITSRITVGSKDDSGYYYIMVDDHNAIYRVASSSLSTIVERTYENTISELLFLREITQIGKISIQDGSSTFNFVIMHDATKEDSDDQLTVECDGKTLSTSNFRNLYSVMIGLPRYGKAQTAPTGKADYVMQLYNNDGSLYLTFEFFKTSSSLYTARTSEGELFTVKASDVSNFITQTHNLLDGKTVVS